MTNEKEVSKFRSKVIESFISIEWIINSIISTHYFKKPMIHFMFDVLYDEYFSFGLKRNILEKILRDRNKFDKSIDEKLRRMNNIRNYFAHCNIKFIKKGGTEFVPDPRKRGKPLDFEKLYKEFIENQKDVFNYLKGILEEDMGIPFLDEYPIKK